MAVVTVDSQEVRVRLSVVEEVLALHGSLHIPLRHVVRVSAAPVPPALWRGFRVGANIPGVLVAGTFLTPEGDVFYDIRGGERCLTLELAGEGYRRVVVEVDADHDPEEIAAQIEAARRAAGAEA
jgi:hypothetical protein